MDVDSLIQDLGGCGRFQMSLAMAVLFTTVPAGWGFMMMVFGSYNPGWTCTHKPLPMNESSATARNLTSLTFIFQNSSLGADSDIYSYSESAEAVRLGNLSDENVCDITKSCESLVFDVHASTVVSEWGLVCDNSWIPSIIITIQMAGVAIGSYVAGQIGDRFGRKIALYGNVAIHALANLLAVFSPSWKMFAAIRFFIGFSAGGIMVCSFIYPLEFITQWWRGVWGSIPMWNVNTFLLAIVVFFLRDWRHVHIATCALSVVTLLSVFWAPESMRWLAVKGDDKGANKVLKKIAEMNKLPVPKKDILEKMIQEERARFENTKKNKATLLALFQTAPARKVTIIMSIVCLCMDVVYFGISFGIKSFSGDFFVNFLISSVSEIPGALFVATAAEKLGRRWGSVVYLFVPAVACLVVVPVSFWVNDEDIKGQAITGLALVAKMAMIGGWQIVGLFSSELSPTVIRNLTLGFLNAASTSGAMIAPYIIPDRADRLYISFLIMGAMLIVCCGLVLMFPETKGQPLQDMIRTEPIRTELSAPDSELTRLSALDSELTTVSAFDSDLTKSSALDFEHGSNQDLKGEGKEMQRNCHNDQASHC